MYGKKGVIAPGADADVVVYDPNGHTSIGLGKTHHMNMDYSAWEGFEIDGHVDTVLSRGSRRSSTTVPIHGRAGHGQYVKREPVAVPASDRSAHHGLRSRPADEPAGLADRRAGPPAETHGFDYVWTFDSHLLWQEPYVIYSAILAATRKVIVGPMVTNPATRDWTVHRVAVRHAQRDVRQPDDLRHRPRRLRGPHAQRASPSNLATLRESIHVIRELGNGRAVELQRTAPCGSRGRTGSELEVWVAAYGPLALKLTGEVGDGFILQLADPDIAAWMIKAGPGRRRGRRARPRRRSSSASPPRRTSVPTTHRPSGPTCASSAAGSAAWSATTWPTSSRGTATDSAIPQGADRLHQEPRGLRLQRARPGGQLAHRRSCPTRSSSGSACWAAADEHVEKLEVAAGPRRRPVRRATSSTTTRRRRCGCTASGSSRRWPRPSWRPHERARHLASCPRAAVPGRRRRGGHPRPGRAVGAVQAGRPGRRLVAGGDPDAAAHERPGHAAHVGDGRAPLRAGLGRRGRGRCSGSRSCRRG